MKIIDVASIPKVVLPQHYGYFSQELRGPNTGNPDVSVLFCEMEADGGAELHSHEKCEHILFLLEGELQLNDGETVHLVSEGQALIVEPGDPHEITGTRRGVDAKYVVVTIPPAWTK